MSAIGKQFSEQSGVAARKQGNNSGSAESRYLLRWRHTDSPITRYTEQHIANKI